MKHSPDLIVLNSISPKAEIVVLSSAQLLPDGDNEWIQVMPASPEFKGRDGRGPFLVPDPAALIKASLNAIKNSGVIDENHSTDLAQPRGEPAPARGWMKELQARADGSIWARVEWTAEGIKLLAEKAYKWVSPVFSAGPDGTVKQLLRASLVNVPNLDGMAALHSELLNSYVTNSEDNKMDFMAKLRAALKLPEGATEADILAAIGSTATTQLQSALAPIAKAAGLAETATADQIVTGIGAMKSGDAAITTLQAELVSVTTQLNAVTLSVAKDKATAFIDGAIKEGRVGVKSNRDHYISRHASSAAAASDVEKEITSFPKLSGTVVLPQDAPAGEISLNAEQKGIAKMLGVPEAKYIETLKAEAAK